MIYKYPEITQRTHLRILNKFCIWTQNHPAWSQYSGSTISLCQGAELPLISMEFDGPAFLCCGCEPAPALVYIS